MNRPVAETMYENIKRVGLPQWSEADQTLARALQRELGVRESGLASKIPELQGRESIPDDEKRGGGSDDIGDVSWNVPTVSLRFPANIEGGPGHNWANGIAMATPIAHKGTTAGAKVVAMTMLDLLLKPALVEQAWDYFRNVQTKDDEVRVAAPARRQAADLAQSGQDGAVPRDAAGPLLRPGEVQDVPRAAGHHVSDGAAGGRESQPLSGAPAGQGIAGK